jgi:hypothetical protein
LGGGGIFFEFEKVGGGGGIYAGAGLVGEFELFWGDSEDRVTIVELSVSTQSAFLDSTLPGMNECAGFMLEELLSILR